MDRYALESHFRWESLVGEPITIELSDRSVFAIKKDKTSILVARKHVRHDTEFYRPKHPATPLTASEKERILGALQRNTFSARDRLFMELSLRTGLRVSELLKQPMAYVYREGQVVPRFRLVPHMHGVVMAWITELQRAGKLHDQTPLFCSRVHEKDGELRPIARETAWRIIKDAARQAGMTRRITTECLRKSFGERVYNQSKNLSDTQRQLRHKDIGNTVKYLAFKPEFGGQAESA